MWGVILFFGGLYYFYTGFIWLKHKKLIENTPTSKIRAIAMGPVEVYGKIMPADKTLKSPLTGATCFYFKSVIEEYKKQGKHSKWVVISTLSDAVSFFVKDDTGRVLVDSKDSTIDIPQDYQLYASKVDKLPATISALLKKQDIAATGLFNLKKNLRFTEYYLAPGDLAYVFGTAASNPFVKDGTALENSQGVIIQKGSKNSFFYISDSPEKEVTQKFSRTMYFSIFGGAVASLVGLFVIFIYFNVL
jgi:hypothetical protein